MIREGVGDAWQGPWAEIDVRDPGLLAEAAPPAGVILTGSAARIADQSSWMLRVQERLQALVEERVPIFGICFGHQLLGVALGGRSGPNPLGREIGTATFSLAVDDPLLGEAPRSFPVATTHLDSVLELPPEAVALGSTPGEPQAAIRFGARAWGVQFHPEFDAEVIGDYVSSRLETLRREGFDPELLLAARRETPESEDLLRRFVGHVHQ